MNTMDSEVTSALMATAAKDGEAGWIVVRNSGPGYASKAVARNHELVADEPEAVGGTDSGPTPYEILMTAVGSCTAMTIRSYAGRKGWDVGDITVHLRHVRSHQVDCESCDTARVGIDAIERKIEFGGSVTEEQRSRILAIADRCPVKQTLESGIKIV